MSQDLFDRKRRRAHAARALASPMPKLLRFICDDLLDRIDFLQPAKGRALVLGLGGSFLAKKLPIQGWCVISCALAGTAAVLADEDFLPFADKSFDLILCPWGLDSVSDLPGALALIRRALRPGGLFLGAMVGDEVLPLARRIVAELSASGEMPAQPRFHPQIDIRSAGDLLGRAGFRDPVVDAETVSQRFDNFPALVREIRLHGSAHSFTEVAPLTRAQLKKLNQALVLRSEAERCGIIFLTGKGPKPSQAKG